MTVVAGAPRTRTPRRGVPQQRPEPSDAALHDAALRQEVSDLRGLLALSLLMTSRRDEEEIVHIVATAVPALIPVRPIGIQLVDERTRWVATTGPGAAAGVRSALSKELRRLPADGGSVKVAGEEWAWALPLRSLGDVMGHLVVVADGEPSSTTMLMLRSLAQQTGIALANARLHARNLEANAELARTVEALRYKSAIHEALTEVELSGSGLDGIVSALHEVTGRAACVQSASGEVLAEAGGDEPWVPARDRREHVVQRALRVGHPIRIDGRLLTAARPRPDVVGVLWIADSDGDAGDQEIVALEHARTVLSIELSRQHSLAETELRLGRDLAADLLAGIGDDAQRRARALGYDLSRPHAAVVVEPGPRAAADDPLVLEAQTAAMRLLREPGGPPVLLVQRESAVVAVVPVDVSDDDVALRSLASRLGPAARVAVGGMCHDPASLPASLRQAQVALRISRHAGSASSVVRFERLGVYRLLAESADPAGLEDLVRSWLGPLVDYDADRNSDLVRTLASFLDHGGNYDATADALTIGRTTVRYRLRRIRELTGYDLSDPETRFQLHLAVRAHATRQALA
ncbi:MAG: helix-turn-helix domain-containing protein [Actinobacteria bacterium]|nr:helix-turn-helix domain-containing protein [Actinomycetota bacterium]